MNNNQNVTNNESQGIMNNSNFIPNTQSNSPTNDINVIPSINQSVNNTTLLNPNATNQPIQTTPNVNNNPNPNNMVANNQVTLGTVNNVSYADTIGNGKTFNYPNNEQGISQNTPVIEEHTPIVTESVESTDQTYLNEMNVNGAYNRMEAPTYVNDQKVVENINGPKKNTITISKELKTVIIIALILLVFIFIMPNIFDLINNFRFR